MLELPLPSTIFPPHCIKSIYVSGKVSLSIPTSWFEPVSNSSDDVEATELQMQLTVSSHISADGKKMTSTNFVLYRFSLRGKYFNQIWHDNRGPLEALDFENRIF
jgi:hypothetical protein